MHALVNLDLEGILELDDTREGYRRGLRVGTHTHKRHLVFHSISSVFRQKSNDFLNAIKGVSSKRGAPSFSVSSLKFIHVSYVCKIRMDIRVYCK